MRLRNRIDRGKVMNGLVLRKNIGGRPSGPAAELVLSL